MTLVQKAGPPIRRWLFGPQTDEPLAFEEYSGATAAGSGSVTELFANRLGSIVTAVAVYTGVVAVDYDYDAYGTRTQVGTLEQPYGYTGREHDAESGLIHLRARAYDPATGTFLQIDPIGFGGGDANLYAYTWNNPYNWVDPAGTFAAAIEYRALRTGSAGIAVGSVGEAGSGLRSLARSIRTILNLTDIEVWENEGGTVAGDDSNDIPNSEPKPVGVIEKEDGTFEVVWIPALPGPPKNPKMEQPDPQPRERPELPIWWRILNLLLGGDDLS